MSETQWTLADLQALEAALAKGVSTVKYTDKEIRYRSLDEMLKLRDIMRQCLGITDQRGKRTVATHSKGLC